MASKTKKPAPAPKKKSVGKSVKPAAKKSPTKPVKSSPKSSPAKSKLSAKPVPKKPEPKAKAAKPAKASAAKQPAAKTVKSSPAAKAAPKKSEAPVKSVKPTNSSVSPAKIEKSVAKPPASDKPIVSAKVSSRDALRSKILQKKGPARPIAFSLDEIREIAKTTKQDTDTKAITAKVASKAKQLDDAKPALPAQPNHIKAASLSDILGFNPKKKQVAVDDAEEIPEKFRRYYRLLIDLRNHLTGQIDTHSEETLKRSSKDDAGDLSSYGQHMADAGTDTFDRDFALSLVSSEQEALSEVEAAIKRIKDGTYGICENTQKPIAKERLMAVPFTRFSAEAQKDIEKNRMRSRSQAGLFGELGEEGATISAGGGGGDDGDE